MRRADGGSTYPARHRPIGVAVVRGASMEPTLMPGDRLLVRYGGRVVPGRIVLARFPDGALVVKRASERRTTATGGPGWWLVSDNPQAPGAMDSRHRGPVAASEVLAVVVGRVWPRPRRLG